MVSGCFALLHIFFPSFDLYLLTLDVETKAVVDAHVLIRNPHQGEQREQISAPILIEQLVASDDQKQNYYVVAKAIFTGEKIEKFTPEDVAARLALAVAILACLAKDFWVMVQAIDAIGMASTNSQTSCRTIGMEQIRCAGWLGVWLRKG
jgi:hypothetical protein